MTMFFITLRSTVTFKLKNVVEEMLKKKNKHKELVLQVLFSFNHHALGL